MKRKEQYELHQVTIEVNGKKYSHMVEARLLLVHYIREYCGLTGTKIGCDTSHCGACTVLLDGKAIKSCTMFAVQADGRSIQTIEGLAKDGKLSAIQQAFWENHGLQCGYCTPGIIMSALEFLRNNPNPKEEEVRKAISGNICRCTGYNNIIKSIMSAAKAEHE